MDSKKRKYILVIMIGYLLMKLYNLIPQDRLKKYHKNHNKQSRNNKYDYIIVGSGTAGSILANRLSENENVTVLLIEAGGSDNDLKIKIPAASFQNYESENDWNYNSVQQKHSRNNVIYHPRGKTIGGSSSINAMIYLRGSAYDYDEWQNKYNLTGWNWTNCLHYFKKSQKQTNLNLSTHFHNYEGTWVISDAKRNTISQKVVKAFEEEMKLPFIQDFNGADYQEWGIGYNQVNINKGERCSLADAMLDEKVLGRKNLFIWTNSHVDKIIIKDKTAIGVMINKLEVLANREVILSAGAYNSPKLLQLSGVGERSLLERMNINLEYENKEVGRNLQDHLVIGLLEHTDKVHSLDQYKHGLGQLQALYQWLISGDRSMTELATNVGEVNGFFTTQYSQQIGIKAPDIQIVSGPVIHLDHGRKSAPYKGGFTYSIVLLTPQSHGTVQIQSSNPQDNPIIDPNIFSDQNQSDFIRVKQAFNQLRKVRQNYNIKQNTNGNVLIKDVENMSDEEINEYIYKYSFLLYHGSCTCAMGKVVDQELKVYGIKSLRVVDASVMPVIPRVNTNAPTAMIAEKAADIIIKSYQ